MKKTYTRPEFKKHEPVESAASVVYYYYWY